MKNNKNFLHILLLSFSGLLVSAISYLYHPLMLHYLTLEEFGVFESLLSLLNLVTVVALSISLFLVKEFSKDESGKKTHAIASISLKYLSFFGFFLFLIFLIFSPLIKNFLQINELGLIILTGTIIPMSFIGLYQGAFLQGKREFTLIAYTNIINPFSKVLFGFFMVFFGLKVYGALGGFIIGVLIYMIARYFIVEKKLSTYKDLSNNNNNNSTKQEIIISFLSQKKQILQYLFTSILIALFMNIDILIVKNIFDGDTAGYYAAISVLAKFLVFLGLSIETVYYPQLVKETVLPKIQLLKISGYYAIMTLGALVFFWLFGETILKLFKDGLQGYIGLVYPLLIYCGLLAYLSIIVKTLIAFEHYAINYMLGVLMIGLVVCLYSIGSSPILVTQIFAVFSGMGLLLGVSQILKR